MTFNPMKNTPFVTGERLEASHVNTVNEALPNAVDGYEGGTYTLLNPLNLVGAVNMTDVTISDLELTNELTLTDGYVHLNGAFTTYRSQPLTLHYRTSGGAGAGIDDWAVGGATAGSTGSIVQSHAYTNSSEAVCVIPLANLIEAAVLTRIDVAIEPPSHSGGMPSNRIRIALYKANVNGSTIVGSLTEDPNSSDGTYSVAHTFSLTGFTETINQASNTYYLRVLGENGSNADDGTVIRHIACHFSFDKLTPG